jgi:hypothetical protein
MIFILRTAIKRPTTAIDKALMEHLQGYTIMEARFITPNQQEAIKCNLYKVRA